MFVYATGWLSSSISIQCRTGNHRRTPHHHHGNFLPGIRIRFPRCCIPLDSPHWRNPISFSSLPTSSRVLWPKIDDEYLLRSCYSALYFYCYRGQWSDLWRQLVETAADCSWRTNAVLTPRRVLVRTRGRGREAAPSWGCPGGCRCSPRSGSWRSTWGPWCGTGGSSSRGAARDRSSSPGGFLILRTFTE